MNHCAFDTRLRERENAFHSFNQSKVERTSTASRTLTCDHKIKKKKREKKEKRKKKQKEEKR